MRLQDPTALAVFQTRKKLSNSKYVHWIIAFVVTIGLGYLFVLIELVKIHDRRLSFYNLKTVNLEKENSFQKDSESQVIFKKTSPTFLVTKDKIILGTLQSLVLPNLKKDSLILSKENFLEDFEEKFPDFKNSDILFPSQVVGIAFESKDDYTKQVSLIDKIFQLVKEQNLEKSEVALNPSVIFFETLPSPLKLLSTKEGE